LEAEIIRFAISYYRGQMSEVARRLKIGRSTLYRKLDEAGAQPASHASGDTKENKAAFLIKFRVDFWMIRQDTKQREPLR
jgi:hypothetical protein